MVDRQVIGRSALRAVRLARKLHLPELLPRTAVATLRSRASSLPLLPLVLAQTLAAAATAVVVRLVVATASVADAELHVTPRGRSKLLRDLGHREQAWWGFVALLHPLANL